MSFRKWMKTYRQKRENAVPDVRDALTEFCEQIEVPIKESAFRPWQRVAALAASVAIVVGLGGYFGLRHLTPTLPTGVPVTTQTSATDNTHSNETTVPSTTPTTQQNTTDRPVTRVLGISINHHLPTSLLAAVNCYASSRMVMLHSDKLNDTHTGCSGVFYDTEKGEIFCAEHTALAQLAKQGITAKSLYIHAYHPVYKTLVFTIDQGDKSSYFYDVDAGKLQKFPFSLYQCTGNMAVRSDVPYVVIWRGGGNNDIYAIQMETGEIINVLKDQNGKYLGTPMDDAHLSTCGKYVIYTLAEGNDANGPGRTTVFYTFATKQLRKFTGELCEEVPAKGCFVLNTPKGFVKYDIATQATTPLKQSDLPREYTQYVKKTDVDLSSECYRLWLCDRLTGKEELLCNEYVYAYAFTPDRRYLCYYIRGEKTARMRDLRTGKSQTVAFDVPPVQQTESGELKDRALLFSIVFEGDNQLILLYTTNGNHRVDPQEVLAYKQSFPYYHLHKLEEAEQLVSILSLEDLLRRFPDNIVAFEGEGFLCLDYTPLTRSETGGMVTNRQVLMEDYDGGVAYDIGHAWKDYSSEFTGRRVGTLSAGAEKRTRMLLRELGIPIQPAPRDYRPYFSNNADTVMKQHLADFSADVVDSTFSCYFVYKRNDGYEGSRMGLESSTQRQEFLDFVRFTDTLSYKSVGDITPYVHFDYTYVLHFHPRDSVMLEIYVGCHNGQYYVSKKDYVATITAQQYAAWQPWLDAKSQEGHLD